MILDANDPESLNIVVAECNRLRAEHAEKLCGARWRAGLIGFVLGCVCCTIADVLASWLT